MGRPRRRKRSSVPGLTWRGDTAYWQRQHQRLPKGRVYRSLRTTSAEQGAARAGALNTLLDRGDWDVLARFASGDLPIDTIVKSVREGEWRRLRQLHGEGVPLRAAADAYLEQVEATLSARTFTMYRSIVDRAVVHFGELRRMHDVATTEAQEYLYAARIEGESWAPRTMGTQRTVLGALWRFAMEREQEAADQANALPTITVNPWRKVKSARIRRTRFSYLRPEEARALLEHDEVRETVAEALLATAIYAGLRLGELAHLRTDIDVVLGPSPRESWIVVQSRDGEHEWRPKTERGERKLHPIPALYVRLVQHRAEYAGERYFFRPEGEDGPPHPSTVTRWVQAAFAAAGIRYGRTGEALTLHSLRHTFATWQVAAGIPVPTVAKRLGDTEIVVLRTYAHAMPEADDRADEVLELAATGGDPFNGSAT